jgi:hypothetical protein
MKRRKVMFIAGVLLFSIVVPVVSYLIARSGDNDKGKTAAATVLVAWGSMLAGLLLSKVSQ